MKSVAIGLVALVSITAGGLAQTPERVDAAAIAKIRDEGLNRSKVMDTMFWLTDRYGPRLTGSPWFEEAGEWAVKQLQSWGVTNAHKERFQFGRGWTLVNFHATMTDPRVMPIIGVPKSWTQGTKGTFTADVLRPVITNEADCRRLKGTLRGKIILTQPERAVAMLDKGDIVMRMDDRDGKIAKEALTMPAPRGGGAGRGGGNAGAGANAAAGGGGNAGRAGGAAGAAGGGAGAAAAAAATPAPAPAPAAPVDPCTAIGTAAAAAGRGRGAAVNPDPNADPTAPPANPPAGGGRGGGGQNLGAAITAFYKAEGVLALFDRGGDSYMAAGGSDLSWQAQHVDGGTFIVQSGGRPADAPDANLPQLTVAVEHYNRMVRLLDHNVPVKVELNIETKFYEETQPSGFNVVGEIRGTDKADEIVVIGAHFDSWHGATGATDNGAGSAAMMEVMRIIKATGLQPRRTIRIGLWGAEEGGLLGSQSYVREHLGTAQAPKPEMEKTVAYYNLDNGTGKIRGIWMQSNPLVEPIFRQWIAPLKDLGVDILGPRSVSQTDHTRFDSVGVPAFQFVQERYEYNSRTHHTNMDFYDRVQVDDMKQQATVTAVFVWQTANRDEKLPRKPAATGGGQ